MHQEDIASDLSGKQGVFTYDWPWPVLSLIVAIAQRHHGKQQSYIRGCCSGYVLGWFAGWFGFNWRTSSS
jgi:hypothetical protein